MSNDGFIPIDPTLDAAGNLVTLVPLLGPGNAKPIPLGDAKARTGDKFFYETSIDFAASIGAGQVFRSSGSYSDRAVIYDVSWYVDRFSEGPVKPGTVIATRWGASLRLALRVRNLEASGKADYLTIAAGVQFGKLDVQYQLSNLGGGLGLQLLASSLRAVPAFGALDLSTLARLDGVFESFLAGLRAHADGDALSLVPLAVVFSGIGPGSDAIADAHAVRYAMKRIAAKAKLDDALATRPVEVSERIVRDTYGDFVGAPDPARPIDPDLAARARNWLKV